jgi:hypothetical protein
VLQDGAEGVLVVTCVHVDVVLAERRTDAREDVCIREVDHRREHPGYAELLVLTLPEAPRIVTARRVEGGDAPPRLFFERVRPNGTAKHCGGSFAGMQGRRIADVLRVP